jgi:hypothetical protein
MATVKRRGRSAASIATERVMDDDFERAAAGGESRFPNFTTFVGADVVTDEKIRESHARGYAVVIVDEHGEARVLPAPVPATEPGPDLF